MDLIGYLHRVETETEDGSDMADYPTFPNDKRLCQKTATPAGNVASTNCVAVRGIAFELLDRDEDGFAF
jgi:hypothetical protein